MIFRKQKDILKLLINKDVHFIYKGSRNQIDEFDGRIINLYRRFFLVKTNSGYNKSFMYADLLIRNLIIK